MKLVQSGLASDVDALWLVTADAETRFHRLKSRSGIAEESARARIAAAPDSVPAGVEVAATIENSGDLASTSSALDAALRAIRSAAAKKVQMHSLPMEKERS